MSNGTTESLLNPTSGSGADRGDGGGFGERPRRTSASARRWLRRAPLIPAVGFVVAVTAVPFFMTVYLSTLNWNALRPDERRFVGLDNYASVLADARLRAAVVNTAVISAATVLVSLALGLWLAVQLHRRLPGHSIARTMLITPFLMMPMASGLLWKHVIYDPTHGLINEVFGGGVDWISRYPMTAVVTSLVWQWTPFMMLIMLAGLHCQPETTLDAARVDGAGPAQVFRYVTLPFLRPYLELGGLLGAIYLVNAFDSIFTITQGGPGAATTNLPYEIYLTTFRELSYGESSAAGVLAVAGTLVIAYAALRISSRLIRVEGR